ncbi:MAG: hypothetical protein ACRCUE_18420, partial [Bosea sp. (in: a-proteobacteria)]
MPGIPVTWLNQFIVNVILSGIQNEPDIIQLSNGNILVAWRSSANTGIGSPAGTDIIGQLFDPLGAPVGGEFLINSTTSAGAEADVHLAALPGGGFVSTYTTNAPLGTIVPAISIMVQTYSAAGTSLSVAIAALDGVAVDPFYSNPNIAVSSATSALVVYEATLAGADPIRARIYNPVTNTFGSEFSVMSGGGDNVTNPDVAVLSNGNYVVSGVGDGGGDSRIIYRILTPAGAVLIVGNVTDTSGNGEQDTAAQVAALSDGGFVITWQNVDTDTDILWAKYNAEGAQTATGVTGAPGMSINNITPDVTGLADGSFVITYRNGFSGQGEAHHYSAAGGDLGVFIYDDAVANPKITDLADGRFAVTWVSSGDIKMEIMDTRDAANAIKAYSGGGWHIGTIGNDLITPSNGEFVYGWDGDDVITENLSTNLFAYGGAGNDTMIVLSDIGTDYFNGGDGLDTIDWSASDEIGATFDLQNGTATDTLANVEQMLNFENLIGTNNADTILGSGLGNVLNGAGGNDLIYGLDGNDMLEGGGGNDLLNGGTGSDTAVLADVAGFFVKHGSTASNLTILTSFGEDTLIDIENVQFAGTITTAALVKTYADPITGIASFGTSLAAGGWSSDNQYHRELADVNNDGRADIIGFGGAGTFVALAKTDDGSGTFNDPFFGINSYGFDLTAGGWANNDQYPRTFGDVNGDGRADIIGFGGAATFVSLAKTDNSGTFNAA